MAKDDDARPPVVIPSGWEALRRHTPARIALGRAGTSLPTGPHLQFQLAHARARSAVHRALDTDKLLAALGPLGQDALVLDSRADDRATYLQRPDAGRRLAPRSAERLQAQAAASTGPDVALIVADGLSAFAVEENIVPLLGALMPMLDAEGWTCAPLVVARQARVALGDEVGGILKSRMAVMLIGERPGLSSPDSLGIYMTLSPRIGLTDEARNCISNVRAEGLAPPRAAQKLRYLMREAFRRNLSGVALKDEEDAPQSSVEAGAGNFLTGER